MTESNNAVPSPDAQNAGAQSGLAAGPLRMTAAGLLVGAIVWFILQTTFPFFETPKTAASNSSGPPGDAALAEMTALRLATKLKNATGAGLLLGALAGIAFALTEGASRTGAVRSILRICLAVVLGAGLGALAGHIAQSFHIAYEHDRSMDPMLRAAATQAMFWSIAAGGIGLGIGLFASRPNLILGAVVQAVLGALVFAIAYVAVASFLFPLDDTERIFPASSANSCVWSVGGFGVIGLLLGLARKPAKTATKEPAEE